MVLSMYLSLQLNFFPWALNIYKYSLCLTCLSVYTDTKKCFLTGL